jgi:hypothetical protein
MDADAAAWVRTVVLARVDDFTHNALITHCPCQWGRCGYCVSGEHLKCAHTVWTPPPTCETYVIDRRGGARTQVWLAGKPCRWVCPCSCRADSPGLFAVDSAARGSRRHGEQPPGRAAVVDQPTLFDLAAS